MRWRRFLRLFSVSFILTLQTFPPILPCLAAATEISFEIKSFTVEGNTLLTKEQLNAALSIHTGREKTVGDVEAARADLEKQYHTSGYPTVVVNIPEQNVDGGEVRLNVVESKIRRVRVTGNRYFTKKKIMDALPSLKPGAILYVPNVQKEMAELNRHPDIDVSPALLPGKEPGTIDVELKVQDKLALHGSVEVNNRHTHDTSELRLNGVLKYDNLWQKDHSISVQYQTSPQEPDEVQTVSASYILPAFWNRDHMIAGYGLWSDSDTAFGEGFQVLGKGVIFGLRYIVPLPSLNRLYHSLSLGIDYKDFEEDLGFLDENGEAGIQETPIRYSPISADYTATLKDDSGYTRLSAGVNIMLRGLSGEMNEFAAKRYKSRGNYLAVNLGLERKQALPFGFGLDVRLDGQISNQPLISNEQYIAGGMASVRGYMESEALGDNAAHASVELSRNIRFSKRKEGEHLFSLAPYLFYDGALLRILDPLPGQEMETTLQGTGGGLRMAITEHVSCEGVFGVALNETDTTSSGDGSFYFMIKGTF